MGDGTSRGTKADSREAFDKADADDLRVIQPSMSKTDVLLQCSWPWGRSAPRETVGEPALFGSAFHESTALFLFGKRQRDAAIAKRWGVDAKELRLRLDAGLPVLDAWLRDNEYGLNFRKGHEYIETPLAYDVYTEDARHIRPPDEQHVYQDVGDDEQPGTLDYASYLASRANSPGVLLILDTKTGWSVPDIDKSGQLLSIALAMSVIHPLAERFILAFFRAPERVAPHVFALEVDRSDLNEHAAKLRAAFALRRGNTMTVGPECARCPGFAICPTNTTTIVELRGSRHDMTTPEGVGAAHQSLSLYKKRFEALAAQVDGEIRDAVRRIGFGVRPDGQTVSFIERPYTQLSMATIKRALGDVEGAKLIEKLKKAGVVEEGTREELRAQKP